ncbi:MAG: hypothetical protein PHP54_00410 [Clostridia bacterium]|nr:hypothetical protein [Clostridia bacterium]
MENNELEMPVGFSLSIGMNQKALSYFANLDSNTKNMIKSYIQNNTKNDDAKFRINTAVEDMANQNLNFLNN